MDEDHPEYKKELFKRILTRFSWRVNQRVKIRGTRRIGKITYIEKEFEKVIWKGQYPLFVAVLFDGDEVPKWCSHYNLTTKRAR